MRLIPPPGSPPDRAPRRSLGLLSFLLAICLTLPPAPAAAQDTGWFPDRSAFSPLLAAPQEPGFRGSFVLADRTDLSDFPGTNVEAEVNLGHHFGVYRFQEEDRSRGRPALDLGFEVGISSRFFMESPQRDLIHVDYRVGLPLALAYRGWEGRLEALHFSSHLADDYLRRIDADLEDLDQISREGVELILARRPAPGLRIYAGGRANFHSNELAEETSARFGVEWDPGGGAGRGLGAWPFLAGDVRATDHATGLGGTGTAGVLLRLPGQVLRLEARGHFGPSSIGQLTHATDETFLGLGLRLEF